MPSVTMLGVDDFACRRGHSSGAMLRDWERQRVVALLPDRSPETCAAWLRQHPQLIQVMSRDRGGAYAAGAQLGAPQAVQSADRFHLRVNAGEAVARCLTRHAAVLTQAAQASAPDNATARMTKHYPTDLQRQHERRNARLSGSDRYVGTG